MFGYNYKMKVVNPEKGVVKLTPTLGTMLKVFAPSLILAGGLMLLALFQDDEHISVLDILDEETSNDE